jgi:hypothetical protein
MELIRGELSVLGNTIPESKPLVKEYASVEPTLKSLNSPQKAQQTQEE